MGVTAQTASGWLEGPRRTVVIALLLSAATFAAYAPLSDNGFINFDDPDYVTRNPVVSQGLSWPGIKWAFTAMDASNWHPLTWISHMLDCQLFGLEPGGHHLVNLLFHLANTILLFIVLQRMSAAPWKSAFVAALFALHPLHVESVAWISERKDVLSGFFALLTLLAYTNYVRMRKPAPYWCSILLFGFGLMAKPMLVTLPFVLLLLDFWPLQRNERWPVLILEKVPMFALTTGSCVMTWLAQRQDAVVSLERVPFQIRAFNALDAYAGYLGKIFRPADLALPYPFPDRFTAPHILLCGLLLLAITAFALRLRRGAPWIFVGWCWFLGMLVPVIGLVQVGGQAMADRYTYLPSIGIFIALTWSIARCLDHHRAMGVAFGCAILAILGVLTCRQTELWHDDVVLFEHAAAVTQRNSAAYSNAALGHMVRGESEAALADFREALKIRPEHSITLNNLGVLYRRMDRNDDAISAFRAALAATPDDQEARYNLAVALATQGKHDEAIREFSTLLQARPGFSRAHYRLGLSLEATGRRSEAIEHFREALRLNPNDSDAAAALGRFK